jgi:putative FmdB family regulatory protein
LPLYEYKCAKCGHRFEKIENFSAPEVKKCPKCGKKAERQVSPSALQFKGSGWYVTDYGGKGAAGKSGEGSGDGASKAAEKAGEKGGEKSGEKSGEKAGESKPVADKGDKGTSRKKK